MGNMQGLPGNGDGNNEEDALQDMLGPLLQMEEGDMDGFDGDNTMDRFASAPQPPSSSGASSSRDGEIAPRVRLIDAVRRREHGLLGSSGRLRHAYISDKFAGRIDERNERVYRHIRWLRRIAHDATLLEGQLPGVVLTATQFLEFYAHADDEDADKRSLRFCQLGGMECLFDALKRLKQLIIEANKAVTRVSASETTERASRLKRRRFLADVASALLIAIREILHCIGSVECSNRFYARDEHLAFILSFLELPGLANGSCYAADELLARPQRVVSISVLAHYGVDIPKILLRLGPRDLGAASHLLAFFAFDASHQDPINPFNARRMMRRSRETATHEVERVRVCADPYAVMEEPYAPPRLLMPPFPVSVSPAVDDNHATIVNSAEGLLLHRLLVMLAAPPPPPQFQRAARMAQQLQQGNTDVTQLLEAAVSDPSILLALRAFTSPVEEVMEDLPEQDDAEAIPDESVMPSLHCAASLSCAVDAPTMVECVDVTPVPPSRLARVRLGFPVSPRPPASQRYLGLPVAKSVVTAWETLERTTSPRVVPVRAHGHSDKIFVPDKLAFSRFDVARSVYDSHDGSRFVGPRVASESAPNAALPISRAPPHSTASVQAPKDIFSEEDLLASGSARSGGGSHEVRFSQQARTSARQNSEIDADSSKIGIVLTQIATHKTEIAFAIAAHMSGPKRRQLQDYLVAQGVLPLLADLFRETNWLYDPGSAPPLRVHGPTCQCRPETAGTIQVMRLLYTCMDRDCEDSVQRWLPRRRMLMQSEIRRAFDSYSSPDLYPLDFVDAPWAAGWIEWMDSLIITGQANPARVEEGDFVDESAVLMQLMRCSQSRPWWDLKQRGNAKKMGSHDLLGDARSGGEAGVVVGELQICDPALCGRNAQFGKEFSVDDVDSGDDDIHSRAQRFTYRRPDPDLLVDKVCLHAPSTDDANTALAKAMSTNDAGPWSPELVVRSRGIVSLLLHALVLSSSKSPYRGWLSSCIETFIRGSPEPVRRWVCAHGLVRYLVRVLLDEYAAPSIRTSHAIANAADASKALEAADRKRKLAAEPGASNDSHTFTAAPYDDSPYDSESEDDETSEGEGEGCDEEELSAKYSLQSMFDVLGECMRWNVHGIREVFAFDVQWTANTIGAYTGNLRAKAASSLWSASSSAATARTPIHEGLRVGDVICGTTLMRLGFDRLTDGNVFFRNLFLVEDVAYGLCAAAESVTGCARPVTAAPCWASHRWSWESLADASRAMVAPSVAASAVSWYDKTDASVLCSPSVAVVRDLRIPLVYQLMASTTVNTITQETLCCLNTALCCFLIAHRHGALPAFVDAVRSYDCDFSRWATSLDRCGVEPPVPAPLLLPSLEDPLSSTVVSADVGFSADVDIATGVDSADNDVGVIAAKLTRANRCAYERITTSGGVLPSFAKVCAFWLEYYSLRDRDRKSLRTTYGYCFEEWRAVVRALLGLDTTRQPSQPVVSLEEIGAHPLHPTSHIPVPSYVHDALLRERAANDVCVAEWLSDPYARYGPSEYWSHCALLRP